MHTDPRDLVSEVFARLNAEDWPGVAALCDEGSLLSFQRNLLWGFGPRPEDDDGFEKYWREVADVPLSRARAEDFAASVREMWSYMILGAVLDGDGVAHVLYRTPSNPRAWDGFEENVPANATDVEIEFLRDTFQRTHPGVITCHRGSDGFWRIIADASLLRSMAVLFAVEGDDDRPAV